MRPSADIALDLDLHRALLDPGPLGPRLLFETCGERLYRILRQKYSFLSEEPARDAAIDALLELINAPERYNPQRGSLMNYLVIIGCRRVVDQVRRDSRRPHIQLMGSFEALGEDGGDDSFEKFVEDWTSLTNQEIGSGEGRPFALEDLPMEFQSLIIEVLPKALDRQLLALFCDGRRDSEEWAGLLGITHLPKVEQRKQAKKHRDRILARLKRRQADFDRIMGKRA